jgi:MoaA/NifB/PqqE/SkfB family radical SAM enzyme
VHFDLTYRCNERCIHCYVDHDDRGEMDTAEVRRVLEELSQAGTLFTTFDTSTCLLRS